MARAAYRIHLDPIGGIAGDMFVAALADAFPESIPGLLEELDKLPLPDGAAIRVIAHRDAVLSGRRFDVRTPAIDHCRPKHQYVYMDQRDHHVEHAHVEYEHIVKLLREAPLGESVRERGLALFASLAAAEAAVHGIDVDEVVFHEVGAWDSIVDFVAAAYLIDTLNPAQWTCAPVPIGGGRVQTQHGVLPVPAPATTLLLRGLSVVDDGVQGERVTPTGASILKYLLGRSAPYDPPALVIGATGNGFGSKTLPGLSNVLRCIAYMQSDSEVDLGSEEVSVATFEIDDQTPEDLSIALDKVRNAPGVLDVLQGTVFGKKGRIMVQVQVLMRPENATAVADLCFSETSTLGLRLMRTTRKVVPRSMISLKEPDVRVKLAVRPHGQISAKAEMDDLVHLTGGKAERDEVRRAAERKAIEKGRDD